MKPHRILPLAVLAFVTAGRAAHAQEPPDAAGAAIQQLAGSAQKELAKSIADLNGIREQIANEKLPLDQDLTKYETLLTQLRRDHDKATRLVDEGNLELSTIRNDIKVRKDELSYIANLLDEYARTFETKVNVSEMQYCGNAVDNAKQASENNALSSAEKFDRQLVFANLSLKRLFDVIGGMRFPGIGVDMQGSVVPGQFAIIGPVALFAAPGGAAGLVVPQNGSNKPLIRPLEGALQLGLVSLVENGEGEVPLDPSLGGALKALVQKTNLIHIFEKGGPIMWPLLCASILSLGTVLERILFLVREKMRRSRKSLDEFFAAVQRRDLDGAVRIGRESKFFVVRALGYALERRETSLQSALLYAQAQEIKRFRRGIPILDTVITLAPLLGLLGTVTGMMGSFSLIGGDLSAPGAITGGIAEALIATAFGLGIAITSLLPFNFLNARTEDARHELESAATQLELMVHPHAAPPASNHQDRVGDDVGEAEAFAAIASGRS
jgi:biopolymer transport protein ExbB